MPAMEPSKPLDLDSILGRVTLPQEWKMDQQGKYANTTKPEAEKFFDEKSWEKKILALAAIAVRNRRKVCFVTGGFNQDWEKAVGVVVQEIKTYEQIEQEFSGDVPPGVFFVQK